jgi:glycosyltransferase involved in cell wall biosynthesis
MNRIPVVIAGTNCLSGVTTWAEHLRATLAGHPRYEVKLLQVGEGDAGVSDIVVSSIDEAHRIVRDMAPLIMLPNYLWELYLAGFEPGVACLGMCHADNDEQYYRPLTWYEPMITQFVAVSRECSAHLRERLPFRADDVTTLPYGIPVPHVLTRDYRTNPLRIVYAGRVTQLQKRVWDFVPLVERLIEMGVRFVFDVVGEGDEYEPLRGAMMARFAGYVRFHARVPYHQMATVWSAHDVFVQTSDFEGTSVSMLEAMAYGVVPTVTAASSGIDGVIHDGENGCVVPVGDMDAMARCIAHVAAGRDRLAALGAAAHQTAQGYALERYAEQFADVLDRVADAYSQVDMQMRYGMFANAHPLLKQRQMIAQLQSKIARLEANPWKRFASRMFAGERRSAA